MRTIIPCLLTALACAACDKTDKPGSTQTSSANSAPTTNNPTAVTTETKTPPVATTAPVQTSITQPAAAAAQKPVVTWKGVGLSTPESIIHDDLGDTYLVSNVDGKPLDPDGKGFISKLSPDGAVANLKWIEGGKNKVTLNAPKGMALTADNLYVADIDTVRMFDRKTGAPKGELKIAGASFLNDVAIAADGRILVSDSAMKAGASGFEPTGSDAVYALDKDIKKATPIAKAKDLGGPNGLLPAAVGDKTWVVTFGSGELYSVDAKGKKGDVQKLPKGSLDGILPLGDDILVSSWDANAIYRGKPGSGGEFKTVIEDVKSPADIGYDKKRGRVLVPNFNESEVRAYELK